MAHTPYRIRREDAPAADTPAAVTPAPTRAKSTNTRNRKRNTKPARKPRS